MEDKIKEKALDLAKHRANIGWIKNEDVEWFTKQLTDFAHEQVKLFTIPVVSGSAFIADADSEKILVITDDKNKVFNKLREVGKTWKHINVEPVDLVI